MGKLRIWVLLQALLLLLWGCTSLGEITADNGDEA